MNVTKLSRWAILSALIALHLAGNFYPREKPSFPFVGEIVWSEPILLAAWATWRYGHALVRLPFAALLLILLTIVPFWLTPAPEFAPEDSGMTRDEMQQAADEAYRDDNTALLAEQGHWNKFYLIWLGVRLLQFVAVLPLFWLVRFARGWQIAPLERIDQLGRASAARLTVRTLLVHFSLVAAIFASLRSLGPVSWATVTDWPGDYELILIISNALGLLAIPCVGLALARSERRTFALLVVAALALVLSLLAAVDYVLSKFPAVDFLLGMRFFAIMRPIDLFMFSASAFISLITLRLAGFRLLRKTDVAETHILTQG